MHLKSKNRKCEQEMVDSVKQHYSNLFVQEQSSSSVSGQSKYCDITLEYNRVCVGIISQKVVNSTGAIIYSKACKITNNLIDLANTIRGGN